MFENKRICPKCGSFESESHAFCSQCGANLNPDYEENEEKEEKKKHPFIMLIVILVLLYLGISTIITNVMSKIGSEVNSDILGEESNIDKCSEFDIKQLAIESFKERDYYFRYILPKSIANVYLNNTEETSHLLDSNKYYCKGTIEVLSEVNGFEAKEQNEDNPFYEMIFHAEENPVKEYLDKLTTYKCDIEYTIENPEGSVKVESSYCGSNSFTDTAPKPEFSCEGICEPTILKEEIPEEEQKEEVVETAQPIKEEQVQQKEEQKIDNNEISNETKIRESIEQGASSTIPKTQEEPVEEN